MDSKNFKNPPASSRPAPFWSWNDDMTKEELTRQIAEMDEKGWGSFFMHSRVGLVTPYLEKDWMELVDACTAEAKQRGLAANLYDEDKWPSGFAAGEIPKNEAYRQRMLCLLTDGTQQPGDTVLAHHDGFVICERISPIGNKWFNGYCYVDLMNPDVTKAFLESTHEKYAHNCGEEFSKTIQAVFTDEPCYLMYNHCSDPVLPWSPCLPSYFKEAKGYDIKECLPSLFFNLPDSKKIRFDFFDAATALFTESFTKPYAKWCEEHGLKMTGHFMAEDGLAYQTAWIGAAMPQYEYMQWPGIDKLARHQEQLTTVKQLTSATEQLGNKRNLSEVFGCCGQFISFFHRKWIAEWQAVLGLNFVNHHLSLYSMRGERKRDFPANLFYQQPWWDEERGFADYIGRVCEYEATTRRRVDALMIHPIATAWSLFDPIGYKQNLPTEIDLYDKSFDRLSKDLIAAKLDFHYGDETIMASHAKVSGNSLTVGDCTYRAVIIPPALTLHKSTVALLDEFAREGGTILSVYPHPTLIEGQEAPMAFMNSALRCTTIADAVNLLSERFPAHINIRDARKDGLGTEYHGYSAMGGGTAAPNVFAEHKFDESGEYYFVVNTEENREIPLHIDFAAERMPVVLDLSTGETYAAPAQLDGGRASLDIKLYPAGSILLKVPATQESFSLAPAFLGSGAQFTQLQTTATIRFENVEVLDENTLPLNDVTLYLDGKLIGENMPLGTVWHKYFYPAANGTPFKAVYRFDVASLPASELTAAIESAQNLTAITFNGKACAIPAPNRALDDTCYLDVNFRKVALGMPVIGENELVIEGVKINNITAPNSHIAADDYPNHLPTEVEAVYITGDFSVRTQDRITFAIAAPYAPSAADITADGYPFYAGSIKLTASFDCEGNQPGWLRLTGVNAACARVSINGQNCGIERWEPFAFDISNAVHQGKNTVEVTLPTTLYNLMGPNRITDMLNRSFTAPETFVDMDIFTEKYTLLPFGIKGAQLLK